MIEKKKLVFEKTVLVGVISARQDEDQALEYLAELGFLAHTAGGEVIKQYTQKITLPNPKTFIGSGKLMEVQSFVEEHEVSTVVFDDELKRVMSHGVLHYCGYKDKSTADEAIMRSKEDEKIAMFHVEQCLSIFVITNCMCVCASYRCIS